MNNASHEDIRQLFNQADRFLLASHVRPDGDAIGSLLGLGLALENAGKDVVMVLTDGVAASFRFMTGYEKICTKVSDDKVFDLVITLDASDPERIGNAIGNRKIDLNIDHHITNLHFGKHNLVDPSATATSEILTEHLESWGLNFTKPVAEALLTGLITDTIGFRTSNMSPKALKLGAKLMEAGANLPDLYNKSLIDRSYAQINYWGYALEKMERKDRLVWTALTLADRKMAGYNGNDDADLNTLLSSIAECDVTVLFVEQNNHHIKVSWRAKPGFNVSELAFSFNGGGHPAAAGADIEGTLAEVKKDVLEKTTTYLKNITKGNVNNGN
jgi:phosphoesterase RecJ-like protein